MRRRTRVTHIKISVFFSFRSIDASSELDIREAMGAGANRSKIDERISRKAGQLLRDSWHGPRTHNFRTTFKSMQITVKQLVIFETAFK